MLKTAIFQIDFKRTLTKMSDSELRFRRTVKIDNKEESVDLLTLALKKDAEYDKVSAITFRNYLLLGNFP